MKHIYLQFILLLLAITTSLCQAQTDWESYKTSEYSISYPPTWKLKLGSISGSAFTLLAPLESGQNIDINVVLNVLTLQGNQNNLEERVNNGIEDVKRISSNFRIVKRNQIIKNGNKCEQLIYTFNYSGYNLEDEQNCIMFNGKMYTLTVTSEASNFYTYQPTAEKILSSFLLVTH